jgi:uncharacterized protein
MDSLKIIEKYYQKNSIAYLILVNHSKAVTEKALQIVKKQKELSLDIQFIKEAAMLHDIGIFLTNVSDIECFGKKPYLLHGVLGKEILEKEGYEKHARVCENHIIISKDEIIQNNLPLDVRDMFPLSNEEEVISLADKFFSKSSSDLFHEKSIIEVKEEMKRFGIFKINFFNYLVDKYQV